MHSIIIPHRNRGRNLVLCLWSIHRSAQHCGISDYEVVVVDNGSVLKHTLFENVVIISDNTPMSVLNKPRLQNIGIEKSQGDILTFLDADAIVGKRWMENVATLEADPVLTRLCYRVRLLPEKPAGLEDGRCTRDYDKLEQTVEHLFTNYDCHPLAHEGYGRPEHNRHCPGPIFGNSQFSMRRDVLGDLRYNEDFVGCGYEDLWFIREIWKRDPAGYRAAIMTDPDHAMFHINSPRVDGDWYTGERNAKNARKYHHGWGNYKRLLSLR